MKVSLFTFGCKLNFAETSTISRKFKSQGFDIVDFNSKADVYIINSCSVTENADKECKKIVKKIKNKNPNSIVGVIGCYAQLKPEEISNIDGVNVVLDAKEKFNIPEHINKIINKKQKNLYIKSDIKTTKSFNSSYSINERTRSFLKIQDGCDYKCSYCTIPLARGRSRCDSIENIIKNINNIIDSGVKEIVLTGVNIGDYKYKNYNFYGLLKEIEKINRNFRIRISSIEPNLVTTEIIKLISKSTKITQHFHLPLQSGSDTILKKMQRRYNTKLYLNKIKEIKKHLPDCCIGADVIVGFPYESEDLFLETYNFIKNSQISYLHVFSYSERENTKSTQLLEKQKKETIKKRSKMLRILSDKIKRKFYEENIGKTKEVLFETKNKEGNIIGFTDNYIKIEAKYDKSFENKIIKHKLSEINKKQIFA